MVVFITFTDLSILISSFKRKKNPNSSEKTLSFWIFFRAGESSRSRLHQDKSWFEIVNVEDQLVYDAELLSATFPTFSSVMMVCRRSWSSRITLASRSFIRPISDWIFRLLSVKKTNFKIALIWGLADSVTVILKKTLSSSNVGITQSIWSRFLAFSTFSAFNNSLHNPEFCIQF